MKKIKVAVLILLSCAALICASVFFSHIHLSRGGPMFIIGGTVVGVFVWYAAICALMGHGELSRYRQEAKDNFKFLFSRPGAPVIHDGTLADLASDYGLSDSEVERIAKDGVHEAAVQYRKSHPLDHP